VAGELLDSVNAFQQAAQMLRRFQLQMGGVTSEISRFLQAAQATGASMSGVSSGIGIFEKKLADTSLRLAVGSEESHEFARAMGALGVDIQNADGSIRTLESVMPQLTNAFAELGPGAFTTGLAMDLFGRAGRELLPVLLAGSQAMEENARAAERLGAVMTSKDVKASDDLREATNKLDVAIQGFKNTIARQVIPFLVALKDAAAEVINTIRQLGIMAQAVAEGFEAWKRSGLDSAAFTEAFNKSVESAIGALTQEEEALEKATVAQQQRNQEVAAAAFERVKVLEKVDELNQARRDKELAAEEKFATQWEDIVTGRERQIEDAIINEQRRREDIERRFQRKIFDILDEFAQKRDDREAANRRKLDDFWARANLQREKLLNRHLEKMKAIRDKFEMDASEAARRNDAVAFLRAQRRRDFDLDKEKESYKNRRDELEKDIALRLKKLLDSMRLAEEKEEARLERALELARRAHARQLEDLDISLRRQEEDRQRSWDRQLADFNLAKAREAAAIQKWYDEEITMLNEQLDRVNAIINRGRTFATPLVGLPRGMTPFSSRPPASIINRAEGGIDVVSSPTLFRAGEAGPEVAAFFPLNRSVHLSSDPFNVNVSGVDSPQSEQAMKQAFIRMMDNVVRQVR
jgi:hypothetical protein